MQSYLMPATGENPGKTPLVIAFTLKDGLLAALEQEAERLQALPIGFFRLSVEVEDAIIYQGDWSAVAPAGTPALQVSGKLDDLNLGKSYAGYVGLDVQLSADDDLLFTLSGFFHSRKDTMYRLLAETLSPGTLETSLVYNKELKLM